MNTLPPSNRPRQIGIDAARGAAALAVLIFHSLGVHDPGSLFPGMRFIATLARHGHLGVNAFFAISGWCIAARAATSIRCHENPVRFIEERILRIYPAYWAAVIIAIALRLFASPFNRTALAEALPPGHLAAVSDMLLIHPYLGMPGFLLVGWTLVYELGFYALIALGLCAARTGLRPRLLLVIASLLCLWPLLPNPPAGLFVLSLWPDFFIGLLAWQITHSASSRSSVIACLLPPLILLVASGFRGELAPRLAAIGTALVLALASHHDEKLRRLGVLRTMAIIGGFSYSLYLIHVPVLSPFMNLSGRFIPHTSPAFIAIWLSGLALALGAGWGMHRLIEAPVERWRKNRKRTVA